MGNNKVRTPHYEANELITLEELAKLWRVSQRKLWSLTASGQLPHLRIGRSVRYCVDDLRDWVKKNTKGGDA